MEHRRQRRSNRYNNILTDLNILKELCDFIMIATIIDRLNKVNELINGSADGVLPFEDALAVARFYYDFQDTNALIDEAEKMAEDNINKLETIAKKLRAATRSFLVKETVEKIGRIDFEKIATDHSSKFYSNFQKASEALNPYWKRYCELSNRLDFLPLGTAEYKFVESDCEEAKREHDVRKSEVDRLYSRYEQARESGVPLFGLRPDYIVALVSRIESIANSILTDIRHIREEEELQ